MRSDYAASEQESNVKLDDRLKHNPLKRGSREERARK